METDMFGYVFVNKPELKFREFDMYRSYYCGLCHKLSEKYGIKGALSLSYDMTFLVMLLTGLYEPKTEYSMQKCMVHPIGKHQNRENKYTDYAADMTILLAYFKCMDDWQDEKKIGKLAYAKTLSKAYRGIYAKYEKKAEKIQECLLKLNTCEKENEKEIDKVSGLFGQIVGEIFWYEDDIFKEYLYRLGFYLGKFIYLMDAYEDVEHDIKKGNYNVLSYIRKREDYEEYCKNILCMMLSECSKNFEKLPILQNVEILQNILYAGVWTKYEILQNKRKKEK